MSDSNNFIVDFIKSPDNIFTIEQFRETVFNNKDTLADIKDKGTTFLILTTQYFSPHKEEIVKILIDAGYNLDIQDKKGKTALMHALQCCNSNISKMLIDAGADVNLKDKEKQTALIIACNSILNDETLSIIKMLLDAGSDLTAQNKYNDTALILFISDLFSRDYFVQEANIIKLLLRLQSGNDNIRSVLINGIKYLIYERQNFKKYAKIIEVLLNMNSLTNKNEEVLMFVFKYLGKEFSTERAKEIIMLLLNSPINLSTLIGEKTGFERVCEKCDEKIVKYCFEKHEYTEDDLIRCIKLGKHQDLLTNLLCDLYLKKTVYFKSY